MVNPRKGWRRGFEYLSHRVQRLPDTPHRIALGVACGVLASFTPFFMLHIFVALGLAVLFGANVIAAAVGTAFSNPLTFPFIASLAVGLGRWMMGVSADASESPLSMSLVFSDFGTFMGSIFVPYLLGGLLPGTVAAGIAYAAIRPAVAFYQARRRARLVAGARWQLRARSSAAKIKKNPVPDSLK